VDAIRDGVLYCTSKHVASQRETAAWDDIFTSELAHLRATEPRWPLYPSDEPL
jgi:hypothetical protein